MGELMVFTTPLALAAGVLGGAVVFGHAARDGSVDSTATTSMLASCNEENPHLAVTAYVRYPDPDRRTVVAVRDSFPEDWDVGTGTGIGGIVLARESQTGNVHGLAVDPKMGLVYTSAYFKAQTSFGPAGPGGIYRITVDPHRVEAWMSIPAGIDRHDLDARDAAAATWAGRTGLGDLELSEDGGTLFATNLSDRLIYRISVPERRVLSTMQHGAADEPWAANARPFGLAVHQGWVYHGLVDSREDSTLPGSLSAHVYRSRADGSMLSKVASFALDYPRTSAWKPWQDRIPVDLETRGQPMLTDLGVRANGDIVVALTDRLRDVSEWVYANGDLVRLRHEPPSSWHAMTDPPHYEDGFSPESFLGGLAILPARDTTVATARWDYERGRGMGPYWIDNATGGRDRTIDGRELVASDEFEVGDVEAFCDPRATRIYLPIALAADCLSEMPLDVILVVDMSSSMLQVTSDGMEKHAAAIEASSRFVAALLEEDRGHRVSVLGFNDSVWHEGRWSGDEEEVQAALGRLPTKIAEGTRLDLALSEAASTAQSPERRPGVACAVILLTDGIPNRVPVASDGTQATTVLDRASALRATGATVFTIGLGRHDELDLALLSQIATRTENALHAPTAEALVALYERLVHKARCGGR